MKFMSWFNKQHKLVKVILLLIPFVNWIVEILMRFSMFIEKKSVLNLIIGILCIPGVGIVLGYLDIIWVLIFDRLILTD